MPRSVSVPQLASTGSGSADKITGNDAQAQQFLSSLDEHPVIGGFVDQTMAYDYERAEMKQKTGNDCELQGVW